MPIDANGPPNVPKTFHVMEGGLRMVVGSLGSPKMRVNGHNNHPNRMHERKPDYSRSTKRNHLVEESRDDFSLDVRFRRR